MPKMRITSTQERVDRIFIKINKDIFIKILIEPEDRMSISMIFL
ncbi:hypothetical protein AF72_03355 [Xylella taiwanensis]|uniref:Uncharacterized protein n=1 Tax=Xylella taiwanensis TaxID=1444770 RepID=Z9JME7_9GAMM|nr:hypothetical protein AF72_03355 [Xylella taiwanensis]